MDGETQDEVCLALTNHSLRKHCLSVGSPPVRIPGVHHLAPPPLRVPPRMLARHEVFPHVIEMNLQARRRLGCSVYLVHDAGEWMLIDIGYEDTLDDMIGLIRDMDFPLNQCKYLIATHADVDHIQGLKRAKEIMPQAQVIGHPQAAGLLAEGERIMTYAEITAQGI